MPLIRFTASLKNFKRLAVPLIGMLVLTACTTRSTGTISPVEPVITVIEPAATAALPSPTPTAAPTATAAADASASPTQPEASTATAMPSPSDTPQVVTPLALPDPRQYTWEQRFSGLQFPVFITGAGDGSGRLFIVQQTGVILVARDGQVLAQPFLDIRDLVKGPHNSGGGYTERGLLGLAFDPGFAQNGLFYVHYSEISSGDTVLARYRVSSADPDQADLASAVILLTADQPYSNHNGGMIAFGPDGMLYMGLGDGGNAGDPLGNGQNLQTLLGKILRLDVRGADAYAIPADNPFTNGGGLPEIWAYGLRNPWRFSFDRLTGNLFIADVGQKSWEEINLLPAGSPGGANLGWNYREGAHEYQGQPPAGLFFHEPLTEYSHSEGCSVSGGIVVRDMNLSDWQGVYLYGDFCTGRVWGLLEALPGRWVTAELFKTSFQISSFGEDDNGEVYLIDLSGSIYRLTKK